MLQRILYGSLAILFLFALFLGDAKIASRYALSQDALGRLLAQGSLVTVFAIGVLLAGTAEMHRLLRANGAKPFTSVATVSITAILLVPWFASAGWFEVRSVLVLLSPITALAIAFLLATLALSFATVLRASPEGSIRDFSSSLLTALYLGFLPAVGLQLRCGPRSPNEVGAWLLLAVILITKASDIGAYFVGSAIGRHKLIPSVSPAKSVEGSIGGLLMSGIAALGFGHWAAGVSQSSPPSDWSSWFGDVVTKLGYPNWMLFTAQTFGFGVALSIAAQFGDLLESCFKRDAGIKDTGNIMPRFGGVLDLVDSPILAMPVAWLLLAVVWGVV